MQVQRLLRQRVEGKNDDKVWPITKYKDTIFLCKFSRPCLVHLSRVCMPVHIPNPFLSIKLQLIMLCLIGYLSRNAMSSSCPSSPLFNSLNLYTGSGQQPAEARCKLRQTSRHGLQNIIWFAYCVQVSWILFASMYTNITPRLLPYGYSL